jgi:hypothetical protein
VLGLLLVWDIVDEILQQRRRETAHWRNEAQAIWSSLRERGYRPVGMMALTGLWVFGMTILGFYVTTTLFIVAGLLLLGERRAWLIVVFTVLPVGATYLVFTATLRLRLPTGMFL